MKKAFVWVLSFVLVFSLALPVGAVFADDTSEPPHESSQTESDEVSSTQSPDEDLALPEESDSPEELVSGGASESSEVSDVPQVDTALAEPSVAPLASAGLTLAPGRYRIRPAVSNVRLLDVANGSSASGANIQIYRSNKTPAQYFDVSFDSKTGYYTIKSSASDKVLDVESGLARQGGNVQQYAPNGTAAQQWELIPSLDSSGKEFYKVVSALPGGFVLDIAAASDSNGANVQIYTDNGTRAQRFYFVPEKGAITAAPTTLTGGYYTIASRLSSLLVIDVPGASAANGTQLQLHTANGTVAQVFDIRPQAGNFYTIRSLNSGSAVDVFGGEPFATTPIMQYAPNGTDAQLWSIEDLGGGVYTFKAKSSGLALDVANGIGAVGAQLQLYYPNGTAAQQFTLKLVSTDVRFPEIGSIVPYTALSSRVDIPSGSKSAGVRAQIYQSNNTLAQKFEILRVGASTYAFRSLVSGLYLTADAAMAQVSQQAGTAGAPGQKQQWKADWIYGGLRFTNVDTGQAMALIGNSIGLVTPVGSAAEAFRINSANVIEPGYYIAQSSGGLALDVVGGSTANGANVQLYASNNSDAQKWELQLGSDGYYTFLSPKSKKALDIAGGQAGSNANIQIHTSNSTAAQKWKITPSGDGFFYLKSALGYPNNYLAAPGNDVRTTQNPAQAVKFSFIATKYSGYYGTYADVNLTTQKMFYVKDGELLVESDIVSGSPSMRTPTGNYHVTKKQSPATLVGPDYRAPVSYWMAFVGNAVGFHDATWQSGFGGNRWTYAGSHGCVNMPLGKAQQLYSVISVGDAVNVHY